MIEKIITDKLNMPCLNDEDEIYDKTFVSTPILTNGLFGNGAVKGRYICKSIDIFMSNRDELKSTSIGIVEEVRKNGYVCSEINFQYEKNAGLWRATFTAYEMEEI